MTEPASRRVFLALWPDAAVREALVENQKRLAIRTGRRVQADNLHITLLFLGATPASRLQCLEQALATLSGAGFQLQLDYVGYWRKPQVLWVGARQTPAALTTLVQQLRGVASGCGCEVETRPFEAHLTLCRKVLKSPRDLPALTPPILWSVGSFVLVESQTASGGVQYRILREWMLTAGSTSG